ncbi:hypothetical protein QYE76_059526 [Lolium multiflorum]|uniref:F-box domain-containing protein n=1 Tax=Lolium multiflorum TaxID=4521 RepID=A0AAD8RX63_LOLMU|nr:hypothetical protein QYE76_048288 [Lolium multiflorum]KAK1641721.1 hypothetical protein QYE76_059526 [Lolium multiflorum]
MKRRASTAATLPDELVVEILARVTDVPAVFRCATACKRWRRLIADPFFLRDCWPKCAHHPPSYVLGFFDTRIKPPVTPAFVPLPRLAAGLGRNFIVSFPSGCAALLDHAVALASRGGLLLVRRKVDEEGNILRSTVHQLVVCDPISGTCNVLPRLVCQGSFGEHHAILTDADICSSGQRPLRGFPASFKVIVLAMHHGLFTLHTFSSGDPSWSSTKQCFEQPGGRRPLVFGPPNAVVCHGAPHWLVWNWAARFPTFFTLGVSAETSHVFLTKISTSYFSHLHDFPRLSVSAEGALSLLCLRKDGRLLETWTRQDNRESKDGGPDWLPSPVIEVNLPKQRRIHEAGPYVCLSERNGVLLIKDTDEHRVYLADIKAGAPIEEVTDSFYGLSSTKGIVPFEVDLLDFFISRLGSE